MIYNCFCYETLFGKYTFFTKYVFTKGRFMDIDGDLIFLFIYNGSWQVRKVLFSLYGFIISKAYIISTYITNIIKIFSL